MCIRDSLCGVLVGDGHLSVRKSKHEYAIYCLGHKNDEREFYDKVIIPLFNKTFSVNVKIKSSDRDTTYGFVFYSKVLVNYFSRLGIPTGNKSSRIRIPTIFKSSDNLLISFIRGLADTDFCLTLKRRYKKIQYYPVIVGVSKSKDIIYEISKYLKKLGFRPSLETRKQFDKRVQKLVVTYALYLYGHKQTVMWMQIIGFKSSKHLKKFDLWKKRNIDNARANSAFRILG